MSRAEFHAELTANLVNIGPDRNLGTASLEYEELNFYQQDGVHLSHNMARPDQLKALRKDLKRRFGVIRVEENRPFLLLRRKDDPPPRHKRPFSIAGCLAIWLDADVKLPTTMGVGIMGGPNDENKGDSRHVTYAALPSDVADDLNRLHITNPKSLIKIYRELFPNAIAISSFEAVQRSLLIEYAKTDEKFFTEKLLRLPTRLSNSYIHPLYNNGPLSRKKTSRLAALNSNFEGKRLLLGNELSPCDEFVVDCHATGQRKLMLAGIRVPMSDVDRTVEETKGQFKSGLVPYHQLIFAFDGMGHYLLGSQLASTISDREVTGNVVFERTLPLVRAKHLSLPKNETNALFEGAIGGYISSSDLLTEGKLFCFTNAAGKFIDETMAARE